MFGIDNKPTCRTTAYVCNVTDRDDKHCYYTMIYETTGDQAVITDAPTTAECREFKMLLELGCCVTNLLNCAGCQSLAIYSSNSVH